MKASEKPALFYRIYFSALIGFAVLLIAGLGVLYAFLRAYEAVQPQHVADTLATALQTQGLSALEEQVPPLRSPYESAETADAAFAAFRADRPITAAYSATVPEEYDAAYTYKAGDEKFLTVYFAKAITGGKFGLRGYTPAAAVLKPELYRTVTVYLPTDAAVTINGVPLDTQGGIDDPLPELPTEKTAGAVTMRTCTVSGLLAGEPTVEATTDGQPLTVTAADGIYTVAQAMDAGEAAVFQPVAIEAAKLYAARMQNDVPFSSVSPYLVPGTEFYQNLAGSLVRYALEHTGYEFTGVSCTDPHRYTETLYSCRVRFDQVLHIGSRQYVDHFDKTVYLRRTGSSYRVVDMQNGG